jgi:hypothetical protein
MGSFVEVNDTLQLTKEQGFPAQLDLEQHFKHPITLAQVKNKTFSFHNKKDIRIYHSPPVRNFLAENRDGKWIYWGKVLLTEITHDYVKRTTSGKFRIITLFSPEEMREAFHVLDQRAEKDYFQ